MKNLSKTIIFVFALLIANKLFTSEIKAQGQICAPASTKIMSCGLNTIGCELQRTDTCNSAGNGWITGGCTLKWGSCVCSPNSVTETGTACKTSLFCAGKTTIRCNEFGTGSQSTCVDTPDDNCGCTSDNDCANGYKCDTYTHACYGNPSIACKLNDPAAPVCCTGTYGTPTWEGCRYELISTGTNGKKYCTVSLKENCAQGGTATPTPPPCVESCTTQRTCVIAGNCAGGTQKLESTNRCNTGSPSKYWCVKRVCSQICSGTPTPTPTIPTTTWRPTPTSNPTPIPPTPGPSAKCVATDIYSPNWTPITTAEFYNLLPNSQVYFCVKGSTSSTGTVATPVATSASSCSQVCTPANSCLRLSDCINKGGTANNKDCDPSSAVKYTCSFKTCSTVCTGATPLATTASQVVNFDKARFTINGVLRLETTTVRPNTQDFCDLYTIPANTYNFKVQGEIHHPVYGWL